MAYGVDGWTSGRPQSIERKNRVTGPQKTLKMNGEETTRGRRRGHAADPSASVFARLGPALRFRTGAAARLINGPGSAALKQKRRSQTGAAAPRRRQRNHVRGAISGRLMCGSAV